MHLVVVSVLVSRSYHPKLSRGEWVSVVDVLLRDVDVEAVLAYLCPSALSDETDHASVFDLAPVGCRLDDVVDRGPGKTPVAEVEYRDPIGPAESALDWADSA